MKKLKLNDEVVVTAGKDKGKTGKVKSINEKTNRVVVEGVNLVKKALKATQENPGGGIGTVEASLHRSNIMVASPKTKKPTRVKIVGEGEKKKRIAVACGSELA